jgi:glycerophosphoryl diester phosphodiesterase
VLLKSAPEPELLKTLEEADTDIMYMPILKDISQWDTVKQYDINVAAAELIFADTKNPLVSREMFEELSNLGIVPWVNSITLGEQDRFRLSGEFDDNRSIREGFDAGWGSLVRMGFGIIQTDWPGMLYGYLHEGKKGLL